MAVVNLPDSPANGTTQTVGGITYTYNSSKGYWTAAASGGGGGGGASVTTDDSAPGSPSDGDLWYDTDEGGMFVYYEDADSSQWVEVIGSQGAAGAAGAAGADGGAGVASVYATVDNLPTSGNSQGDMAHVTANNTLYFWNGSGWYKIALINTNPSISGVSSSYALAIDGTATTVTLTATDPEGLPITYSIASDTSGNTATVAQGSGGSSNIFTVTPSTNTAYAGSFTLTFRASDGVNLATAPATFTLQFSVENQRYTTALITSVGANNAVNNSFDDKSTNDHAITTVGNATQTTFSPYRHGGYSTYFDGTGDYLEIDDGTWLTLGNGNFCFETWIYNTVSTGSSQYIFGQGNSSGTAAGVSAELYITASRTLSGGIYVGSQKYATSTGTIPTNTWTHVALVRNGTNIQLYINGTKDGENTSAGTDSAVDQSTHFSIGRAGEYNGLYFNGYITDFRFVNGSSVHTGTFTAPTERLTAITNTSLLTCHLPYIADGSTNSHAITINGNTKPVPFAPYDAQEYTAADHGGSMYFDGSGDYLHMPQTSLDLGSDDFCVEAWVYTTSTGNQAIIGSYRYADGVGSWNLNINYNSNQLRFFIRHSGGSVIDGQFESGTFPTNQWVHVAVTRDGSNLRAFINGTQAGTTNTALGSNSIDNASVTYRIGASNDNNIYWNGNIADVRVVKGSSVYTSNFTPTTTPLTAITNTELLVQSTDAGIIDKAQGTRDFVLTGNVKSSTTQNKFLTTSMYFDGSGDYMKATNNDGLFDLGFNGEPFTIEWWQWWPTIQDTKSLGPQTGGGFGGWNGSNGHQLTLFTYSSAATLFYQWWNGSGRTDYQFNHGGAFTASTWQHIATVFDGTNLSTYIDGSRIGHRTSGNTFGSVSTKYISLGSSIDGVNQTPIYYSDVRISKGLARYSGATITVPTAALQG